MLLVCYHLSILDISNTWKHHAKVRTTNFQTLLCALKSDFMDVKRFESEDFLILVLCPPLDNVRWLVHLAGVGSLNLPFLIANGFNLYQIAVYTRLGFWKLITKLLLKLISYCIFPSFQHRPAESSGKLKFQASTNCIFWPQNFYFTLPIVLKTDFGRRDNAL